MIAQETTSTRPAVGRAVLEGFRAGDAGAFAEVVRAFSGLVRSIVCRFWPGAFMREEAMQEIWVHVFQKREVVDPARSDEFGGWLAVLARRKCIDLLRKQGRSPGPGVGDPAKALERVRSSPTQEQAVQTAELLAAAEAFKAGLRPAWSEFFELHFVQGLGYAEVSDRLGISRTRCKYMKRVLVGRARRNLGLVAALGRHLRAGGDDAP